MRRPATLLATLAVAACVLVPSSGSAHAAGALAGAAKPQVGECHNLTAKGIEPESDSSQPVPCSQTHTTQVFAVPDIPARLAVGSDDYAYAVDKACTRPWVQLVADGDYKKMAQSSYGFAFFAPTAAQRAAGAHWVRCDVILYAGDQVQPLTRTKAPLLKGPVSDEVARCATSKYKPTTCRHPHAYRWAAVFKLSQKSAPTSDQAGKIAAKRCPKATGTTRYVYHYTSPGEYAAGDRIFVCERYTTR